VPLVTRIALSKGHVLEIPKRRRLDIQTRFVSVAGTRDEGTQNEGKRQTKTRLPTVTFLNFPRLVLFALQGVTIHATAILMVLTVFPASLISVFSLTTGSLRAASLHNAT